MKRLKKFAFGVAVAVAAVVLTLGLMDLVDNSDAIRLSIKPAFGADN